MMVDEAATAHAEETAAVEEIADAVVTEAVVVTAGAGETAREKTAMRRTSSPTMRLSRVVIVMSGRLPLVAHLMFLLLVVTEFRKQVQAKAIVISWRVIRITAMMIQV